MFAQSVWRKYDSLYIKNTYHDTYVFPWYLRDTPPCTCVNTTRVSALYIYVYVGTRWSKMYVTEMYQVKIFFIQENIKWFIHYTFFFFLQFAVCSWQFFRDIDHFEGQLMKIKRKPIFFLGHYYCFFFLFCTLARLNRRNINFRSICIRNRQANEGRGGRTSPPTQPVSTFAGG